MELFIGTLLEVVGFCLILAVPTAILAAIQEVVIRHIAREGKNPHNRYVLIQRSAGSHTRDTIHNNRAA